MKVILLDDVTAVGRRGEVRDVSDGFARNFLLPKKLAVTASAGNLKNLEHIKKQQDAKADRVRRDAESMRARIEALMAEERRQASEEGKLFGSVTAQDLVDFLGTRGLAIERRRIVVRAGERPIRPHDDAPVEHAASVLAKHVLAVGDAEHDERDGAILVRVRTEHAAISRPLEQSTRARDQAM